MPKSTELVPLTKDERTELDCLEKEVEAGHDQSRKALLKIHAKKLYSEYKTFEEYCQKRWGIERRQAYRMIESAKVVENVSNLTQIPPPRVESHARLLGELPPEKQGAAWEEAVDLAKERGEPITAAMVEEVVAQHIAQAEPYQEPDDDRLPWDDEPPKKPETPKLTPDGKAKSKAAEKGLTAWRALADSLETLGVWNGHSKAMENLHSSLKHEATKAKRMVA
jgi:hypothetical protein